MNPIKIKCKIVGSGIDYKKRVEGFKETDRNFIKLYFSNKPRPGTKFKKLFFYTKTKGGHYTQSGYKVITFNPGRNEFYHREPTARQLKSIERNEQKL